MNLFKSMCGNCGFSPHCDAEKGSMNTKKNMNYPRVKEKKSFRQKSRKANQVLTSAA